MKLYYRPGACATACHIVLEELGIDHELERVTDEQLNDPEYRKISPRGQVPVLETADGRTMTESVAIMVYLNEAFGEGRLAPERGSWDHGEMMSQLLFMASQEHLAYALQLRPYRFVRPEAAEVSVQKTGALLWDACLTRMDGWLVDREWLAGDQFSLADCLLIVHARWGFKFEKTTRAYPNLMAHASKLAEHPSIKRVFEVQGIGLTDFEDV